MWHCKTITYVDRIPSSRPASIHAISPTKTAGEFRDVLLTFVCVESSDSARTATDAAAEISRHHDVVHPNGGIVVMPFAHLSSSLAVPDIARSLLHKIETVLSNRNRTVAVVLTSFGFHKDIEVISWHAIAHPGSVAFREIGPRRPKESITEVESSPQQAA
jgi:threonyl-tRNA synthetase